MITKSGRLKGPITDLTTHTWAAIEKDKSELWIDLFELIDNGSSSHHDDSSKEQLVPIHISPYHALRPLLQFRQLHHLTLTSMLDSYQPLIWCVCWLSPFLKTLHLEMCLPPSFNHDSDHPHDPIDGNWRLKDYIDPSISQYLGHHGEGILHDEFGEGEYLDSQAIKMSQQDVARDLPFNNLRYLPIEQLTLMNFVIDGGAFASCL